jgi:hypothetical protein
MPKSLTGTAHPDRRSVVLAGGALLGLAALPGAGTIAQGAGLAPATDFLAASRKFLAVLEPEKRRAASFEFNGREWRGWNYFGVGGFIKPGLRLEQMSAAQKAAAWDVVAAVMSKSGTEKTRMIMLLQDVMVEGGQGVGQRSSERFSFSFFGTPAETGTWGFRLEGHHLTQSVTVRDGQIVSVTPSSFSAIPNRVSYGRHKGLVALKEEEALARRLLTDLSPRLQARARVADYTPSNIMSYAGQERANAQKTGLPAAEFTSAQRDLIWQLVEVFSVDYLSPTLGATQKQRVRMGDREAVHFAWYGANIPERPSATASSATTLWSKCSRSTRRRSTCTPSTTISPTCSGAWADPRHAGNP